MRNKIETLFLERGINLEEDEEMSQLCDEILKVIRVEVKEAIKDIEDELESVSLLMIESVEKAYYQGAKAQREADIHRSYQLRSAPLVTEEE